MPAPFNQEGQSVYGPQTNIIGNVGQVNVGSISDQASLIGELERLKWELARAAQHGEIDQDIATEAEDRIGQAGNEANESKPDRRRFLDHLAAAQDLLRTAASAADLAVAVGKVAEIGRQLL